MVDVAGCGRHNGQEPRGVRGEGCLQFCRKITKKKMSEYLNGNSSFEI